jgi:hypothetical protein
MKKLQYIFLFLLITFSSSTFAEDTTAPAIVSAKSEKITSQSDDYSHKGKKNFGLVIIGAYEITYYESLYFDFFATGLNIGQAGANVFIEYGFADRISASITTGYSRIIYANGFKTQMNKNVFNIDLLAHYYFLKSDKFMPYATAGFGTQFTTTGIAPLLDLGAGFRFMISDKFSVKAELLMKSNVLHNHGEVRVGAGYHF